MIKVLRLAIAFIIVAVLLPIIPIPSALAAAEPAITITVDGTDSSKYAALKTGNASGFIYNICVVSTGTTDAITLTASSAGTYAWSTIGNASSEGVSITGDPNAANVTLTIDSTKLLAYNGSAQLQLVTTGTSAGTYTIRFQSTAGVKVDKTGNGKFFIEDVNDVQVTDEGWASTSVTGGTLDNGLTTGITYYANRVGKLTGTGTQYDKQVRVTFVPDTNYYIKSATVNNTAVPVLTSTSAETFQYILLGTPEDGLTSSIYNVAVTFAAGYPELTAMSNSTYEHTVFDPVKSKIADTYDVYYIEDKLDTTKKITLMVDAAATLVGSANCTFAVGNAANTGTFTLTYAGSASTTAVVATGKMSLGAKEYTIRFIPVAAYTVSVTGNGTANVKDNGTGNNTASSDTTTTTKSFVGALGNTEITLTPAPDNIVKSLIINNSANLVDGTPGIKTHTLTAVSEFYEIEVEFAKPVTGISLDTTSTSLTLLAGSNTKQLSATVAPSDATNKSVTWASSNTSIATVDANGLVTAVGAGTTTITVKTADGGFEATCSVTVLPTFTATYDGNGNTGGTVPSNSSYASGTSVTVSSNTGSLTKTDHTFAGWNTQADGSGTVYAVGFEFPITSNITLYAQWDTISASGISLNKSTTTLTVGGNPETLTATFDPTNATNKNVTWSSDSTGVATVTQSGVVIAVSAGTAKITVKTQDGGFEATCAVIVNAAATFNVTYHANNGTGTPPTDGNSYLSNALVTVSSNAGTLTRTGYTFAGWSLQPSGNVITSFNIIAPTTLYAQWTPVSTTVNVTGVTLNKTSTTLVAGTAETLTATVAPSGAANKSVTWASSNTSIATVDTSGIVTAVGTGTTTITVTTVDGNKTAVCTVSVIAAATTYPVTVVNGTGSGNYAQGTIVGITANAAPAGYRFLNWTSTNTSINYVNANSATTSFPMPASAVTVTANYILLSQTTDVTYTAVQIGGTSGTADSTGIKITFNQAVTGLTMNDITVTNGTGAVVQSTLSGSSTIYTIKLTSVTKQGKVTIDIGTFGPYNVKTAAQSVDVYKNAAANSNDSFKYGDLSGKGYVDNSDLILMLRYFMQSSLSIDLNAADINGDGTINNADLVLLLKYFARPGTVLGPQ